jgi:hypothetical protein
MVSYHFADCLLNRERVNSPVPNRIEPPTNGNPAPTRSSILADQRNGKQKSIPKRPATIDTIANVLIVVLIDLSVIIIFVYVEKAL